jgi:guanylate kinase
MVEEKKGTLFVLTGASGSGKTEISKRVIAIPSLGLKKGITCTTRQPRAGEVNGVDYYFLSRKEFEGEVQRGGFIEFATVYGELYGNRRRDIEEMAERGDSQIRVIDVQGTLTIQENFPYPNTSIFISAGDVEEHRRRLLERNTDSLENIERRLAHAPEELALAHRFDYQVENPYGQQNHAVRTVADIVMQKIRRHK